jgi:hypothetical protein
LVVELSKTIVNLLTSNNSVSSKLKLIEANAFLLQELEHHKYGQQQSIAVTGRKIRRHLLKSKLGCTVLHATLLAIQ